MEQLREEDIWKNYPWVKMNREAICQWNVQELITSKEDVLNLMKLYRPALTSIKETQQTNDYLS